MTEPIVLLAEVAHEQASHGVPPVVFGVGAFIILMCLLGITFLFSGENQRPSKNAKSVAEVEREHHGRKRH